MKTEITFILPTRNRIQWIKRAIDSCLSCASETISSYVIVIDGESEDGTFLFLRGQYEHNPRVKIIQNKKTDSFMTTCFQGVEQVNTKFVTFMYDDDVLSPYFKSMVGFLEQENKSFIMSYGKGYDVNQTYPFQKIDTVNFYSKKQVLLTYFGYSEGLQYTDLPVSPICCVVTINLLREWVNSVKSFTINNKIRDYFLLKRNIGPDLIIYFSAIFKSQDDIPIVPRVVAQFSEHASSMSIRFGTVDLTLGYWLAKIWALQILCKKDACRKEISLCAASLITTGVKVLLTKIRYTDQSWCKEIIAEIWGVFIITIQKKVFMRTITMFLINCCNKILKKKGKDLPV